MRRRGRRVARTLAQSLWIVPAMDVVASLVLSIVLVHWDETSPVALSLPFSTEGASAALSALGGGMLTFTAFVTSIVLMIIQFGTTEFSPRLLTFDS